MRQAFLFKLAHKQQGLARKRALLVAQRSDNQRGSLQKGQAAFFTFPKASLRLKYLLTAFSHAFSDSTVQLYYVKEPQLAFRVVLAFQHVFDYAHQSRYLVFPYTL